MTRFALNRSKRYPEDMTGEVRIGPAGWSYDDWAGRVYPQKKPRGFHEATYLADFFDTIEMNVTFYRTVSVSTAQKWIERVAHNPRFVFTAKLWQRFTHDREITAGDEREFRPAMETLHQAGKLGALLAQFPWSFKNSPENRAYLKKLTARFGEFPLVIEVRHDSWNKKEFYEWLAGRGVGFCNIDQPVIGRSLRPGEKTTAPVGYIRLHGRNYDEWFREEGSAEQRYNYYYSSEELEPWAERIRKVAESAQSTFVVTNNHYGGKAVANALQLIHLLRNSKVKVPAPLITHFPELKEIAREEPRPSGLFPE